MFLLNRRQFNSRDRTQFVKSGAQAAGPPAHESEKSGHDKLSQNSTFSVNSNAVSLQVGKIVEILLDERENSFRN